MKKIVALLLVATLVVSAFSLVACKKEKEKAEFSIKQQILNALDEKKLTGSIHGGDEDFWGSFVRSAAKTMELGIALEVEEDASLAAIFSGENGLRIKVDQVAGAVFSEAAITLADDTVNAQLVFAEGDLYVSIPDGFDGYVLVPVEGMLPSEDLSGGFSAKQMGAWKALPSSILKYVRRLVELLPDACFDVEGEYRIKISAAEWKAALTAVQAEILADETFKKDLVSLFGEEVLDELRKERDECVDLSLKATQKDTGLSYEFVLCEETVDLLRAVVNVGTDAGDYDLRLMRDGVCAAVLSGTFAFGESTGFTLQVLDGEKTEDDLLLDMSATFDTDGDLIDGSLAVYQNTEGLYFCGATAKLLGKEEKTLDVRLYRAFGAYLEGEGTVKSEARPVLTVTGTIKTEADGFSTDLEFSVPDPDGVEMTADFSGSLTVTDSSCKTEATMEIPALGMKLLIDAKAAEATLPAITAPEGATELSEENMEEAMTEFLANMTEAHPAFGMIFSLLLGGDSGFE